MVEQTNPERTVKCPVEGCGAEKLARGIHLHVRQSKGDSHGSQGEIPDDVDFQDLDTVGTRDVSMDYPETRRTEQVGRLCPYCERSFQGKHGVMIHLGRVAGKKNHPENPKEKHDPDDFPIVKVDENGNIVDVVEKRRPMPSTKRRREREQQGDAVDKNEVRKHIEELREQGLDEQADRAEQMLLGE